MRHLGQMKRRKVDGLGSGFFSEANIANQGAGFAQTSSRGEENDTLHQRHKVGKAMLFP